MDMHNVLATWAETSNEQTGKMIDIVAAAILVKLGESSIAFEASELTEIVSKYQINRELEDGVWTITVKPR